MIVRISNEGQYELDDDMIPELNELDDDAVAACSDNDEAHFRDTYAKLLAMVRTKGRALRDDELEGSDLILPPPDVSLEEAKQEFSGEGLIPG